MTPFERGLVAHLVADWVLQNDWMARHKTSLRHPAAWTHAAIQGLCLALALGWQAGLVLGEVGDAPAAAPEKPAPAAEKAEPPAAPAAGERPDRA